MSMPVTRAPMRAAGMARLPVPQATSSTSIPARIGKREMKSSPSAAVYFATWPKSPADHAACMPRFNRSRFGGSGGVAFFVGSVIRVRHAKNVSRRGDNWRDDADRRGGHLGLGGLGGQTDQVSNRHAFAGSVKFARPPGVIRRAQFFGDFP